LMPALLNRTSMVSFLPTVPAISAAAPRTLFKLDRSIMISLRFTSGDEARISVVTAWSLDLVRDARISNAGLWVARASARASPRPLGETPVMRTVA